jgi:hypothetical protein
MNFRSLLVTTLVGLVVPCLAGAGESVLRMKSGDVKITLLDPDGIRPLADVDVKVQNAREVAGLIQTTTDRNGSCSMTLDAGTYGLAIEGKTVALINSDANAETTHLRLVTPRKPLLVGGAEGATATAGATNAVETVAGVTNATPAEVVAEEESKRRGLFAWVGENGLKTALIIGGAVATGIIIEDENDGPSRSPTVAATPAPTKTTTTPRRARPSTPDIDPPVSN